MTGRPDLPTKLASVGAWVLEEFSSLEEVLEGAGCTGTDESGPGRSYRRNRRVVARLHPKNQHLSIGLPDSLRPDVDALNRTPTRQRGYAWLHYDRLTCDRDTVTGLIARSLEAQPRSGARAERTVPESERDQADLTLLLALLSGFRTYEATRGAPATLKVLREAVFFHWEGPRLPSGGKYSPALPHSPAARQRRHEGKRGGLVYEHVLPVSLVLRRLLDEPPADTTQLRNRLTQGPNPVLITKDEDDALNKAGLRNRLPDPGDPWSRYRAVGLRPEEFAPLTR